MPAFYIQRRGRIQKLYAKRHFQAIYETCHAVFEGKRTEGVLLSLDMFNTNFYAPVIKGLSSETVLCVVIEVYCFTKS